MMNTKLDMACVYYELREAMKQAHTGFCDCSVYYDYRNYPDREYGNSYYKEQAKLYALDAYKGLETYLQYNIILDVTEDFNGVRKFVKIGRGACNAVEAARYFYSQIKYFDNYYKKTGLWYKAAKMYREDRKQFENRVAPYKQSNHELLPAVQ